VAPQPPKTGDSGFHFLWKLPLPTCRDWHGVWRLWLLRVGQSVVAAALCDAETADGATRQPWRLLLVTTPCCCCCCCCCCCPNMLYDIHPLHPQLAGRVAFSYQSSDFVQPMSQAADHLQGLRLSDQELAMYLDLGPYANPSYYVVQVRRRHVGVHPECMQRSAMFAQAHRKLAAALCCI
jgi:hypothetical protein